MKETGLRKVYTVLYKLYRIFVTLPITVASCKRTFSKLAIVKNKLHTTMSQERLQSLLILFSEKDITNNVDFLPVIQQFSSMTERRRSF